MTNSKNMCHGVKYQSDAQIALLIDLFTDTEYCNAMGYETALAVVDVDSHELNIHYMYPIPTHESEISPIGCGVVAHTESYINGLNQVESHIIMQTAA